MYQAGLDLRIDYYWVLDFAEIEVMLFFCRVIYSIVWARGTHYETCIYVVFASVMKHIRMNLSGFRMNYCVRTWVALH